MYTKTNPVTGTIKTNKTVFVEYVVIGQNGLPVDSYNTKKELFDEWEPVGPGEYPVDGSDGITYSETVIKEYDWYMTIAIEYGIVSNPHKRG